ncbi:MAG: hypothetical protein GY854_15155 [Deltaproteobacteria bacterium]|nr:hypothetical protein [Deltaproteobacteria bacterium]
MFLENGGNLITDKEKTGLIHSVNVPGLRNWEELSRDDAAKIVDQYRWIYVNASLKGEYGAEDEATKLSNSLGRRPMVHVYLSRGVFDGTRNTYPGRFHASMGALIESALETKEQLLVTGRSYGVHQSLRAACEFDDPAILVLGIAPAFGAFGNQFSDNVKQYVKDVAETKCKYGMIASEDDIFTWRSGGAAYKQKIGYRGDNDVGRAIEKNKANVHLEILHGADHAPIDEYLRHGLVPAMQRCVSFFGMDSCVTDIVEGVEVNSDKDLQDPQ